MIRVYFVLLLCLSWVSTPVTAGPWLREEKTTFFAFSSTTRVPEDLTFFNSDSSAYVEYGATSEVTLGADLNYSTLWDGQNQTQDGHAIVFLRRPIGPTDGQNRFAYELGIGARYRLLEWDSVLKLGLSIGRGIQTRLGNGWIVLDSLMEFEHPSGGRLTKLDATFGLSVSPRLKTMLQVQSSYRSKDVYNVDIIPSIVWELKPERFLVFGLEARQSRTNTYGLKVGLWHEF